MIIYTN